MNTMEDQFVHWNAGGCPVCAASGTQWEFLATAEQTAGKYAFLKITTHAGMGPTLHRHREQEAFYVLEGDYESSS